MNGGLGAVSTGISEWTVVLFGLLLLVAINAALRRPAERRGRLAVQLRRAHLVLTLAYILINVFALLAPFPQTEAELSALMPRLALMESMWRAFLWTQIFFFVAAVALIATTREIKGPGPASGVWPRCR